MSKKYLCDVCHKRFETGNTIATDGKGTVAHGSCVGDGKMPAEVLAEFVAVVLGDANCMPISEEMRRKLLHNPEIAAGVEAEKMRRSKLS